MEQMIISGQGPIFFGDFDVTNGKAAHGYLINQRAVGCSSRVLKTTQAENSKFIKETCSGQRLDLAEIKTDKTLEVEMQLSQFDRATLAQALFGTLASVTGSTVTGEVVATVAVGDYVHTKHPRVSSVVVKDSAGTPATLVAGTDYVVDSADHGRLKILALGTYTQPLKIDYAYAGYANVTAFTAASVIKGLIFDGLNTADANKPVRCVIPRISWKPTETFDWINDEEVVLTLKGRALYVAELKDDASYGPFMRVDALSTS